MRGRILLKERLKERLISTIAPNDRARTVRRGILWRILWCLPRDCTENILEIPRKSRRIMNFHSNECV